ncbi:PEP-CTERM sorting domain-containing protein [Geobacter sp.]|uniref:PEP-CTERM sorting domain-containing protein n=1 Tax=Geobacter sp. TaxID=46610 RepID=UPI001ACDF765|nr:PEP-CTERM sorting domain-containing protein [Geobacter sp.]CAG0967933.1 hypothetical protein GEOBC_01106 [Geobacteraceae bacterium]
MSLEFHNGYAYVVPVFELFDMNYIDNDSKVLLDNVGIDQAAEPAVIPEPATFILSGGGILALLAFRMRRGRG